MTKRFRIHHEDTKTQNIKCGIPRDSLRLRVFAVNAAFFVVYLFADAVESGEISSASRVYENHPIIISSHV
jgi:hypothetical protein